MRTTLRYFTLLATIASASSLASAQNAATQAGRSEAAQSPLSTQNQSQPELRAGQALPAGQGQAAGRIGAQGAGMSVASFFAHDLRRGNEAEVELGKLASEKSENAQVKKFAQMMVEHHTQFIQQLQQVEGQGAGGQAVPANGAARPRAGQGAAQGQADARDLSVQEDRPLQGNVRRGTGNVRNSESGTDGVRNPQGAPAPGGTSQATTAAGELPGTSEPGTPPILAGQAVPGRAAPGAAAHMAGGQVPHQVAAVLDQAADTELQMTKQMLQEESQGHDFDMGYIGQQIVAHTCMLAKLQALKNSGPPELQQLATQGEQTTRQHLDMAKQIVKQLKSHEGSRQESPTRSASSSAKQPSNSPRENK
jgi:predicted outer membrane protein